MCRTLHCGQGACFLSLVQLELRVTWPAFRVSHSTCMSEGVEAAKHSDHFQLRLPITVWNSKGIKCAWGHPPAPLLEARDANHVCVSAGFCCLLTLPHLSWGNLNQFQRNQEDQFPNHPESLIPVVGVNYDEAIHKVYNSKKAAIDETSSAVGFFFQGILWQCLSQVHTCAPAVGKQLMRVSSAWLWIMCQWPCLYFWQ